MAFHSRLHIFNTLHSTGLVPLFYHDNMDTATAIIEACYAGGARVIEFTNRGNFVLETFSALRKHFAATHPDLILGIGSIVDAPTAALFIAHGADFVVSPLLNPEIATLCNRRKIPYLPGCQTLSEISQAEALGVEIVKLFPAHVTGGAQFVKAVLAPNPWTSIMPTGGVSATQENIRAWFAAGVTCVGMGSQLIVKDDVAAGNFDAISERVQQVLAWIQTFKNA